MASEFELIRRFTACFPVARVPVGLGDDAAVLDPGAGQWCVSTDALVEGVHFTRRHFTLADVGHKALAVNLSDLAAMGAVPRWLLCALGLPRGFSVREVVELGRGMAQLARRHRIQLVGGNITRSKELSVTLTVAGEVRRGRALLRSGARPGQLIYVSGTLGDARAGLLVLGRGRDSVAALRRRQLRPTPRVALGLLSAEFASAAIDVSDGLSGDLLHLCEASRACAEIALDRLPVSPALRRFCGTDEAARRLAYGGGEDYELALAVPSRRAAAFERAAAKHGHRVTCIGRFRAGRPRVECRDGRGQLVRPGRSFDHFVGG